MCCCWLPGWPSVHATQTFSRAASSALHLPHFVTHCLPQACIVFAAQDSERFQQVCVCGCMGGAHHCCVDYTRGFAVCECVYAQPTLVVSVAADPDNARLEQPQPSVPACWHSVCSGCHAAAHGQVGLASLAWRCWRWLCGVCFLVSGRRLRLR